MWCVLLHIITAALLSTTHHVLQCCYSARSCVCSKTAEQDYVKLGRKGFRGLYCPELLFILVHVICSELQGRELPVAYRFTEF